MRFIVYNSTPFSGTLHDIRRWGDAPADMIAMQAGAGETAVAMPDFPMNAGNADGAYAYDSSNGKWSFVGMPEPQPNYNTADYEGAAITKIVALLRDCDWTQLPDAPLTGPQQAEWATYRADLRAIAAKTYPFVGSSSLGSFLQTWLIYPPPYPEF